MEKRILIVTFIVLMMLVIQANASKNENNQLCTICFEEIFPNEMYITKACNHFFCKSCLREWCLKGWPNLQIVCPNCRVCFTSDLVELIPDKIQENEQNRYRIPSYRIAPQSEIIHRHTPITFEPVYWPVTIRIQRRYFDTVLNVVSKKSIFLIFQWYLVAAYLYRLLRAPAYLLFVDVSGMLFFLLTVSRILRQGLSNVNWVILRLKMITYALSWCTIVINLGGGRNLIKAHHNFMLLLFSFLYEFLTAVCLIITRRSFD